MTWSCLTVYHCHGLRRLVAKALTWLDANWPVAPARVVTPEPWRCPHHRPSLESCLSCGRRIVRVTYTRVKGV